MNERLSMKTILIAAALLFILFLYSGNESYAMSETLSLPEDSLVEITSGTAIIPKGNFTIVENNKRFELSEGYSGNITISKDVSQVTIAGYSSNVVHWDTKITIEAGRDKAIELTIENLNIRAPFVENGIDFSNAGMFNNKLNVSGYNSVEGINECAAIHVPNGIQLTINKAEGLTDDEAQISIKGYSGAGIGGDSKENSGRIIIDGGTFVVRSSSGACIGGGYEGSNDEIIINGGNLAVNNDFYGAGIGGGRNGHGGVITINGGTVTAVSSSGAGIGGGVNGDGGVITISGGTVAATGSTGIGGGTGGSVDNIKISGGNVTATGETGIGSGIWGESFKTISISGGTVNANGRNGSGIGGGLGDDSGTIGNIIISGEAIVVAGSDLGAGIGSGNSTSSIANITITGGTVTATAGEYAAGIGGGSNNSGGIITISGGNITATGNYCGAGIGGGYKGSGGTINIDGGIVNANGGDRGAGIGTGQEGTGVAINISGGMLNAKGSTNFGAAIGGGDGSLCGTITITEGTISATGVSGAGIGFNGMGGTIFINGGTITAVGGSGSAGISSGCKLGGTADSLTINEGIIETRGGGYGAGIGGGSFQTAGIITINGGVITSTGGDNGAGIGGGYQGSGGVVNLNGGKITATGGDNSAGIGGGYFGDGADVTVTGVPVVIATGDTEAYVQNIGCGFIGMNSGTLKDNLNNDLIYILFNITNLPEVNIKVEVLQDGNWTKITDDSCQTDEHGLYSLFTYDNYYSGRYTLSKPGYEALIKWYYPYLKNINIITEMNVDNTPPAITDIYIQNGELCIFLDDYGVFGTLYFFKKEDTTYYSKSDIDNISEAMTINLNWLNDVYINMSELNEGYYQIYVADSAENLSVPYEVYYSKPKPTASRYMGSLSSGSERFSIQTKLNKITKNAETDISKISFEYMSENITVLIPEIKCAISYSLSFTKGALSSAKENMYVEVNTKFGTIIFPIMMIDKAQSDKEDKISINIQSGDISDLPIELKEQLKNKPIIQLTLTVNGIQTAWNNPDAPVTVSIPYTPALEDHDLEHIVVWYIDGDGNVVSVPNGRYDKDTGKVTFTASHFSQYAVAYAEKTFEDIEDTEWAKHSIEVLTSKGILQGVTDTEYAPEKSITRADFLYYLVKTLSIEAAAEENFEDISVTSYYYKEISIAKKLGITNGTGNNKFDPDSHITRQDMMVLTENALKLIKNLQNYTTTSEIEKYTDSFLVSDYAKNSISYLLNEGLIVGNDDKINPLGNTTRAEAAAFLYRIYNKY